MHRGNPLVSYVSGQIARTNPLEGGPEMTAMLRGDHIVASTWGDFATKYMDLYDSTPSEALNALGISQEELRDPELHFTGQREFEFGDYRRRMEDRFDAETRAYYKPEVKRLEDMIDVIMSGFQVADQEAANQEADKIQDQIDEESERTRFAKLTPEEERESGLIQDAHCMRRDALVSGIACSLDTALELIFSTNAFYGDFTSELAGHFARSVADAITMFQNEFGFTSLTAKEITVGEDFFLNIKHNLRDLSKFRYDETQRRWKLLEPIFLVDRLDQHSMVKGTER